MNEALKIACLETQVPKTRRSLWVPVLFATTLFVSAFLLFLVQPLIAKMILPKFGGTPTVWNTCMLFFQAALLAGYAYAHAATTWLGARRQAALHVALLALPAVLLPISISRSWAPSAEANPALVLLGLLVVSVGMPFFMVAASAPLLQKWFAASGHAGAKDPYFLYSASNLGSLLALLSYPSWVEPLFPLGAQNQLWRWGYLLLWILTCACAVFVWRSPVTFFFPSQDLKNPLPEEAETDPGSVGVSIRLRVHWVILAFVPSSLMLGTTTYLSTDLAPIPLLWVIPLSLYLVTFILAFAGLPKRIHKAVIITFPVLVLSFTLVTFLEAKPEIKPSLAWLIPIHLVTFFVAALVCHATLAESRPPARNLTEYYLWISLGGVLGGVFNGLLAPLLFKSLAEYYLAMVLACLMMPPPKRYRTGLLARWLDFLLPAFLGMATVALLIGWEHQRAQGVVHWLSHRWMTPEYADSQTRASSFLQSRALLQLGPPLVICLFFVRRPIRFGLGVGAVLWAGSFVNRLHENVLDENRNFFGIVRVISPEERDLFGRLKSPEPADFHFMVHGNIVHGAQLFRPAPSRVPLAYFYPTGPVGQVFAEFRGAKKKPHVAVIGLGAGTLASYGEPGQEMTFYEINPAVVAMAENPRLFTYMRDCQAKVQVVLGDARLRLQEAPDEQFGLIVLDAFSSDAIPVHLLTKEAFELYLSKLAPDGILVMQMTNRYLDLAPLAGRLTQEFHMVCLEQEDENREGTERGKAASHWAVIARREADLGRLAQSPKWKPVETSVAEVWTDDFSNLLGILKWK